MLLKKWAMRQTFLSILLDGRASMASCSSLALRWLSRRWPSTWPRKAIRAVRDGARSSAIICRTSQPWTCSWFRPSALRLGHCPAGPARACLDQRDRAPDSRMDRSANNGSISLERGPALPDPRSGPDLRGYRAAPITSHGYPRQTYCAGLAVAELFFGKIDRIDLTGMPRPYRRSGRSASAADSGCIRHVL